MNLDPVTREQLLKGTGISERRAECLTVHVSAY